MKRTGVMIALALGLMTQGALAKTLNVVTSFSILGDITQEVGGKNVNVTTLVGPDGDPHTFEPSPKDSAALSKADDAGLRLQPADASPFLRRGCAPQAPTAPSLCFYAVNVRPGTPPRYRSVSA